MIKLESDLKDQLRKAASIDTNAKYQVADKNFNSTFQPVVSSKKAICSHQSRSISC